MKKVAIIGSGLTGSYFARSFAEQGIKVSVYEAKNHIGGHIFDYIDKNTNCLVSKYGPHIFHTSNEEVWEWVNKFANFKPFELRNRAYLKEIDKWTRTPFGTHTAEELMTEEEYVEILKSFAKDYKGRNSITVPELLEAENTTVRKFGNMLWNLNYKLYTSKQWGIDPSEVDKDVLKRVPVYTSHYDRYFTDTFEGIPEKGYTNFIKNVLNHENINLFINFKPEIIFKDNKCYVNNVLYDKVIYTGPIDELFNYKFGDLKYRSLKFEFFENDMPENPKFGDPCVDVYPDHHFKFTRITNYGLLPLQENLTKQISAKEYSYDYDKNDSSLRPYYPVNTIKDKEIYSKYEKEAKKINNLVLAGRLGNYKYYNMDKAIEEAMNTFKML